MHRRQVRMYRAEQLAIEAVLRERAGQPMSALDMDRVRSGLEQLSDSDLRARIEAIDVFLARTTRGALDVQRALREATEAVPEDRLRATLRAELLRAVPTYTDDEWAAALAARAQATSERQALEQGAAA
jgi:hypothetical protein